MQEFIECPYGVEGIYYVSGPDIRPNCDGACDVCRVYDGEHCHILESATVYDAEKFRSDAEAAGRQVIQVNI